MKLFQSIVSVLLLLVFCAAQSDATATRNESSSSVLGSFCNAIQGCDSVQNLTCVKNRCECAPGYHKLASDENQCEFVGCVNDAACQSDSVDPNRMCDLDTRECTNCKSGLVLDPIVNRCITLLGNACTKMSDCLISGTNDTTTDDDYETLPICRSGRCICRTNYFPSADWSTCELRNCSSKDECNPFGDDPHRFCSRSQRRCLCTLGYYENGRHSVCLPYIPVHYSLMMPFWLTMIMFTVCILFYISRRLARARAEAHAEAAAAAAGAQETESQSQVAHTLNLPPPSYETIVKEPTAAATTEPESRPPVYTSLANTNLQA